MRTTILSEDTVFGSKAVATIGFFDGVHRGHQFLLRHVVALANDSGMKSMAITFDKHPRQVLNADYQPQLLTTLDDKLKLIAENGIDECIVLPFSRQMAALPAFDFMQQILKSQLDVAKLLIGYDNRFGHNIGETFEDYADYGRQLGIEVVRNTPLDVAGTRVSSSAVRRMIMEGDMEKTAGCLGRIYTIDGIVTSGYHEGRKLGYPTANVDLRGNHLLVPANGVYAVRVWIDGESEGRLGMLNIGVRPTFGGHGISIEANIFDFSGNLYGRHIKVGFLQRIRNERKFDNTDRLVRQLDKDKEEILKLFRL